jgi:hypothetical protein
VLTILPSLDIPDYNDKLQYSIKCVKDMVSEYNENVSQISGHKIKGWSLKNMNRHTWVGWEKDTGPIDLGKFLVEI